MIKYRIVSFKKINYLQFFSVSIVIILSSIFPYVSIFADSQNSSSMINLTDRDTLFNKVVIFLNSKNIMKD